MAAVFEYILTLDYLLHKYLNINHRIILEVTFIYQQP